MGVRHHSPALAAAVPALLDACGAEAVCVELPAEFQPWLPYLSDPATRAPVALAGAAEGRLGFYPFADFSPELAAVRWARERGAEVLCCDLPLSDPARSAPDGGRSGAPEPQAAHPAAGERHAPGAPEVPTAATAAHTRGTTGPEASASARTGRSFAEALAAAGTGRDGEDLWDRAVEVLAPGCPPEAVRRAALGVGWALRRDAEDAGSVPPEDLAREAHMRRVLAGAAAGGRRVAAVVGAFHAPALLGSAPAGPVPPPAPADEGPAPGGGTGAERPAAPAPGAAVTSLVPYTFDLLDSRSGYPAGIRDPRWQQAVFESGGDPARVRAAAAAALTALCRELRSAGHTAGTGEAAETLRLASDLARLRGLPAPGRGELLEAVTTVLGQGEPLGRGRALARALETVLVGTDRGRTAPGTPRSGLGPSVEAELAELRLPCPEKPEPRELRLDPLRSTLDRRREVLLRRLDACGVGYAHAVEVTGTGDSTALTSRWRSAWTPSVPALLDLAGARGVTAAQAAAGTLRESFRRETADGGATGAQVLTALRAAARCDLPSLVADRLADASAVLPASATLPELLEALDLLQALRREHLPGTTPDTRERAGELSAALLETAVRSLPGLAGSDDREDAAALVAFAARAADHRLGLRLDRVLGGLADSGSPLVQGAALAARVLLDLEGADTLGTRAAGWIDRAATPDGRRRLARRLAGLLTAAAPLLQSAPAALDPLLDRIGTLADGAFLDRLPALRGGFDTLSPAGRDRVLAAVTDRLGDRVDLTLDIPPELLALWTAADAEGRAALGELGLPQPADGPAPGGAAHSATPSTTAPAGSGAADGRPGRERGGPPAPGAPEPRLAPADRWRLLLGRETDRLPEGARGYAHALDELYGRGSGEGATDFAPGSGSGSGGGREAPFPTAREWAGELQALFGEEIRQEVLAAAAEHGRTDVLTELDPAAVRPSVELLTSVLSLAGGLPEQRLAPLRPLVRRLVEELARELATRVRPALTGLATPRPTRRPGGPLDLPRTLRANLAHTRRLDDGRTVVVPERPVFGTRARKEADWRLILVVDVSGSMEASVVWSALTAAVLGGVPTLSTHFLAFSTRVTDLTDRVADPLSLLLEVRVGGGTHIAAGLAHARTLVTVPSRTLVVVVSDFEEGHALGGLLGEVRALAASGVHLMGCAALDDAGAPRYSVPVARQLVAAGMPVAALSPLALARWVGDRLRGEAR
ncbi:DUF5682 family protein [Streptomyces sp. C10-9-1]|uniref:DUF5682 family protein n=1 Tax=Streptomyces sp. C10-9-1 TaxID=1859285 RepID=UPI002111E1EB|nr:DUF5682 family protein [Streptomyces sp. C10-9-1]MCQ6555845.1 DUF5682 family protein [Streptomyces sp. C10-9-1]